MVLPLSLESEKCRAGEDEEEHDQRGPAVANEHPCPSRVGQRARVAIGVFHFVHPISSASQIAKEMIHTRKGGE